MYRLFAFLALVGCEDPGWLTGPIGATPLRTARYRIGVRDNRSQLAILLSNGAFTGCALPAFEDRDKQAAAGDEAVVAACRERAQHVLITAYGGGSEFSGTFPHEPELERAGSIVPGTYASARYYGVQEALLLRVDELLRTYIAVESVSLDPVLGEGRLELSVRSESVLEGTLELDAGVAADFVATRCEGDTSLLDLLESTWLPEFCEL